MNKALELYKNNKKVMQVSGYQFPINKTPKNKSYFLPLTTSWGWGTWKENWLKFTENNNNSNLDDFIRKKSNKFQFNFKGSYPFFEMLDMQRKNKIDSWAILWKLFVHLEKGIVLYPDKTLIKNIGFSEDATHTKENMFFEDKFDEKYFINNFNSKKINFHKYFRTSLYLMKKTKIDHNKTDEIKHALNFCFNHNFFY